MNILIIKPSSLGDVVQALPVLRFLRRRYPHACIDWLVNDEFADVLRGNPYLHTVHRWDRAGWRKPRRLFGALRNAAVVLRNLRRARYDMVIDLQGLLRSALLGYLSKGKMVIGFANGREMAPVFYRKKVEVRVDDVHSVDRYVLAVSGDVAAEKEFPIELSADEIRHGESLLAGMGFGEGRPLVIFAPGARWVTKRWPLENFARLAEKLIRGRGVQLALVGSTGDTDLAGRIASLADCDIMDFSGRTTLRELAYLLGRADVVVGNDSGPLHLAAAVGTPVVGLYGPTSPLRTGPYGTRHTVLTSRLECSPCFKKNCSSSVACMRSISLDTVFEACESHLAEPATRERAR